MREEGHLRVDLPRLDLAGGDWAVRLVDRVEVAVLYQSLIRPRSPVVDRLRKAAHEGSGEDHRRERLDCVEATSPIELVVGASPKRFQIAW